MWHLTIVCCDCYLTGSLYNVIMSIRGVIYNVVVRLQTVDTTSSHHSGSARNSIKGDSSCGSSGEEDNNEKTNGEISAESRKSFEPPLSTFLYPTLRF